jgi:glucose-6-phosphate 1-dehydrogenase
MAAKIVKVEPLGLVLFGAACDLAYRKPYPEPLNRETSGPFSDPTRPFAADARNEEFA